MKKIDMQVLLESSSDVIIDKTDLDRIKYDDFVNTLNQFSVE